MKRLGIVLSMVFLFTVPVSSHGANAIITGVVIDSLHVLENGTFFIQPDVFVAGCEGGKIKAQVGKSAFTRNGWKSALSMLLAAATLAKQVDLIYNDNTSKCFLRQVVVSF